MTPTASCAATAVWDPTTWHSEPAWISRQGRALAIVSEARARLIYFGDADGAFNLLNAPLPLVRPSLTNPWPNQGGHRFWLGPQHRWVWPPPAEWEYMAAAHVSADAGVLSVHHAHLDRRFPAVVRDYAWDGERLRCTARWIDDGSRWFGLHVVAVDTPFVVSARLARSAAVPAGFVVARMVDPEPPIRLPRPAVTIDADHSIVRSGVEIVKLGFVPQPLSIDRPRGWRLSVQPGPGAVATSEVPDQGYLSQVWVGDDSHDLAELEQLTPHLQGDATGACSSTIFIEATPPGA